jgi:hypothetical protein
MRVFIAAAAAVSMALAAPAFAAEETQDEEMARLARGMPRDVADYIPRMVACLHWGGEISGDNSERDRQVQAEMDKLDCRGVEPARDALLVRYKSNKAVMERLKHVHDNYGGGPE